MKKPASELALLRLTKATPEARRRMASSGIRLRAAVFEDKRQKLREKAERAERET